jgi:zinc transporter ZupT
VKENTRAIAAGIGFSVGMMVLISVLELVPEAVAAMGAGPSLASAWWPWPSRFTTCPRNSPWRFPR